jgi:hypothetical protein
VPRPPQLYTWADRVATQFPQLPPALAFVLALWSFGMVLAHSCTLSAVTVHLAPLLGRATNTVRQRLREFYKSADRKKGRQRTALDPTTCCGPLVRWMTGGWTDKRVALAIDATSLGAVFTILSASIVYRGCAVPVAWAVLPANTPGAWNPRWVELLGRVAAALGNDWQIVVLSDRGLESPDLFREIVGLGMHPMMRIKAGAKFRPDGWVKFYPVTGFVERDGDRFAASGVAYSGTRLPCTLLACRVAGCADPWVVLTDLPVAAADACWYALRSWIEQGFKVIKSGGWQWHRTRMSQTDRAERLWVAVAVATLWLIEVGGLAEFESRPETIPQFREVGHRRLHRVFRIGLGMVVAGLLAGQVFRGRLVPEPWPELQGYPPLTEEQFLKRPTYPS